MKTRLTIAILILLSATNCRNAGDNAPATDSTAKTVSNSKSAEDILPSWNDGPLKTSIIDFVSNATKEGSSGYIPPENRIATFDNDGTLWAEHPLVQELFALYMVKKMVQAKPALAKKQPFKAVLEGDKAFLAKGGEKLLIELVALTHTGTTEAVFDENVNAFIDSLKYPLHGNAVPVKQMTYLPQIELLNYLRASGFKTFIVTGGTVEFVRAIAPSLYGIPKEQVVGTSFKYKFIDSSNSIMRLPVLDHFNDKEGKPVGIQLHIGQRPAFACGNEGGAGDIAMLKYSSGNKFPTFQMIINHDDSTREFYYQEKDSASLKAVATNKWHLASIKNDWKAVFAK